MSAPTGPSLHERVLGAGLRAGAFTLGPFAIVLVVVLAQGEDTRGLLPFASVVSTAAFLVFLLERRDAHALEVFARAAASGVLATALAPVAFLCANHPGSPDAALSDLTGLLRSAGALASAALGVILLTPAWGLLLIVRARTTRGWPQAIAATLTGVAAAIVIETIVYPGPGELKLLLLGGGGALGGLGLALVDRHLGPRVAPAARQPAERDVGTLLVGCSTVVVLMGVFVPNLLGRPRGGGNERSAIGSLKAITTAQTMFQQQDKDDNGSQDFAPSLAVLGAVSSGSLIDSTLASGAKCGYLFRLARSEAAPGAAGALWCATADPTSAGTTGDRRFWTSQLGRIYYANALTTAPALLDPLAGPPAGWIVLGK